MAWSDHSLMDELVYNGYISLNKAGPSLKPKKSRDFSIVKNKKE
jgi:hypothetical protein